MHKIVERVLRGRSDRQTIAKFAKGPDQYHGLLTVLSAALLGMAIAAPFATVSNFYGLEGQFSIFTGILELLKTGMGAYAIGAAVLFIAIPVLSISTAFDLWYKHELHNEKTEKIAARAVTCGRLWFFVMLATIALIYYLKTSSPDAVMHLPVYYLFLSVTLQKLTLTRISRLLASVKYVDE